MRRILAAATVALLALAGCGNDPKEPDGPSGTFRVATVNVDGRDVRCITWEHGSGGGISCDWQATR